MTKDKGAWLAKVSPNLRPLSKAQKIQPASIEWAFSGKTEMHSTDGFDCQLCNHHDLAKSYEMKNRVTGNVLWVCSKCILRFYKDALTPWKSEDEIASEIERIEATYNGDRGRKNRRKVTAPLMEAFPDVFSQDFMFSRNDGYSAYDIFLFKTYAKLIGVPMDVSDFSISSRTVELRNSIERIPKPLFNEIRGALPINWQHELEDKFSQAATRQIQEEESKQ
jgi:hypothetical protein